MSGTALDRLQRNSLIVGLFAGGLALLGLFLSWEHFWQAYLLAYLFWLEIALGCLGLLMLHHLVGGRWSARIRRVLEAGMMTLPLLALLFLPLLIGLRTLYPWSDPTYVAAHPLVQEKLAWLIRPSLSGVRCSILRSGWDWLGCSIAGHWRKIAPAMNDWRRRCVGSAHWG